MKLEKECVRQIMLEVENNLELGESLAPQDFSAFEIYGKDITIYTLYKLNEAKYLKIRPDMKNELEVDEMTWEGHQFLDTIRDPKVWSKTKEIASHLESVSITLLSNIGTGVINHMIDKSFLS